jgi:hypothetical protein
MLLHRRLLGQIPFNSQHLQSVATYLVILLLLLYFQLASKHHSPATTNRSESSGFTLLYHATNQTLGIMISNPYALAY